MDKPVENDKEIKERVEKIKTNDNIYFKLESDLKSLKCKYFNITGSDLENNTNKKILKLKRVKLESNLKSRQWQDRVFSPMIL